MQKIVKKLLIANSILGIPALASIECYSAEQKEGYSQSPMDVPSEEAMIVDPKNAASNQKRKHEAAFSDPAEQIKNVSGSKRLRRNNPEDQNNDKIERNELLDYINKKSADDFTEKEKGFVHEYDSMELIIREEYEKKKRILENTRDLNILKFEIDLKKLKEEQIKNIRFEKIFFGTRKRMGLPVDLWGNILSFCPSPTRSTLSLVSKKCHNVTVQLMRGAFLGHYEEQIMYVGNHIHQNTCEGLIQQNMYVGNHIHQNTYEGLIQSIKLDEWQNFVPHFFNTYRNIHSLTIVGDQYPLLEILTKIKEITKIDFLKIMYVNIKNNENFDGLLDNIIHFSEISSVLNESFKVNILKSCTNIQSLAFSDEKNIMITPNNIPDNILREHQGNIVLEGLKNPRPFQFIFFPKLTDLSIRKFKANTLNFSLKGHSLLQNLYIPDISILDPITYDTLKGLKFLNSVAISCIKKISHPDGKVELQPQKIAQEEIELTSTDHVDLYYDELDKLSTINVKNNIYKGPKYAPEKLKNVTSLDLGDAADVKVEHFKLWTNLIKLNIGSCRRLSNKCLQNLKNLSKLEELKLGTNRIIDNKLFINKELTNLKRLSLTESGFDRYCKTPYKITDEALSCLPNLTFLDLSDNPLITDQGIQNLTTLMTLKMGSNHNITDTGIQNLTNLTDLDLGSNSNITYNTLKTLTKLKNLILTKKTS